MPCRCHWLCMLCGTFAPPQPTLTQHNMHKLAACTRQVHVRPGDRKRAAYLFPMPPAHYLLTSVPEPHDPTLRVGSISSLITSFGLDMNGYRPPPKTPSPLRYKFHGPNRDVYDLPLRLAPGTYYGLSLGRAKSFWDSGEVVPEDFAGCEVRALGRAGGKQQESRRRRGGRGGARVEWCG